MPVSRKPALVREVIVRRELFYECGASVAGNDMKVRYDIAIRNVVDSLVPFVAGQLKLSFMNGQRSL